MIAKKSVFLAWVISLSFSVCAFAQFDIQKLKTAGAQTAGQAAGALSESFKAELKNIADMLLQNAAQDKVLGQWKNLILANKTVSVDAAVAFVKQLIQSSQVQQKQLGLASKVQDYSAILKQMADLGRQIAGK